MCPERKRSSKSLQKWGVSLGKLRQGTQKFFSPRGEHKHREHGPEMLPLWSSNKERGGSNRPLFTPPPKGGWGALGDGAREGGEAWRL